MSKNFADVPVPDNDDQGDGDHCQHHEHDDRCGGRYDGCDWDYGSDHCVHCPCHCTCLGCEYGPQDGMLMFPEGR